MNKTKTQEIDYVKETTRIQTFNWVLKEIDKLQKDYEKEGADNPLRFNTLEELKQKLKKEITR